MRKNKSKLTSRRVLDWIGMQYHPKADCAATTKRINPRSADIAQDEIIVNYRNFIIFLLNSISAVLLRVFTVFSSVSARRAWAAPRAVPHGIASQASTSTKGRTNHHINVRLRWLCNKKYGTEHSTLLGQKELRLLMLSQLQFCLFCFLLCSARVHCGEVDSLQNVDYDVESKATDKIDAKIKGLASRVRVGVI